MNKIAKQKYYNIQNIIKEDCEYNVLLGERSNGKSYQVKDYCINDYLENGNKLIYLRRYTVEIKNAMVESYFADVDISKKTKGKYELIVAYRSSIYLANYNDDGTINRGVEIGKMMALSSSTHYKSMSLLEFKNIIFEEFITDDGYLFNEPNTLQQLVSTIARRNRIKVFLIGNTISRLCPYFNEWQLFNIPKQKQGTIEIYNMSTDQYDETGKRVVIKIGVELCENSGNNSKMFFGTVSKTITNGAWETKEQPHIPYEYKECKCLYKLTIIKFNMIYICEVLNHKSDYFVFVHPSNKVATARIIQDNYEPNMLITDKLIPLTKGDTLILKLFKMGKICYSDNLTGSEFSKSVLQTL